MKDGSLPRSGGGGRGRRGAGASNSKNGKQRKKVMSESIMQRLRQEMVDLFRRVLHANRLMFRSIPETKQNRCARAPWRCSTSENRTVGRRRRWHASRKCVCIKMPALPVYLVLYDVIDANGEALGKLFALYRTREEGFSVVYMSCLQHTFNCCIVYTAMFVFLSYLLWRPIRNILPLPMCVLSVL